MLRRILNWLFRANALKTKQNLTGVAITAGKGKGEGTLSLARLFPQLSLLQRLLEPVFLTKRPFLSQSLRTTLGLADASHELS